MGFGTDQQIGNRTGLSDLFRGNIGAPQQMGTTQQPNQLFALLQQLLGGQQGGGQINPMGGGAQPLPGGTPLSAVTAQQPQGFGGPKPVMPNFPPPMMGGGSLDVMPRGFGAETSLSSLSNPFGSLINQRFIR